MALLTAPQRRLTNRIRPVVSLAGLGLVDSCSCPSDASVGVTCYPSTCYSIASDTDLANARLLAQGEGIYASTPRNIQNDASLCKQFPGVSFTDSHGFPVRCPSSASNQYAWYADIPSVNGQYVSIYSLGQLAQMLYQGLSSPPNMNGVGASFDPIANTNTDGSNPSGVYQNTLPGSSTSSGQVGTNASTDVAAANALNTSAPTGTSVIQTGTQSNALVTGAAQTNSTTPTASQITNGSGAVVASDVVVGGVDVTSWIETNWVLLAAGAAALFLLPSLLSSGRR